MDLNKLATLIVFWLEWTIVHSFLILLVEDAGSRLVLVLYYILVMTGLIVLGWKGNGEGKKDL